MSPIRLCLCALVLLTAVAVVACGGEPLPTETGVDSKSAPGVASLTAGAKAPKVDICHREGNGSYHLINVSQNAEPAHLAHGDGKPGDAFPGSAGTEVFGAECQAVACEFTGLQAVPNEFDENGGSGAVTYGVSAPGCSCDGQVTEGGDWLSVGDAGVEQSLCSIDFAVAAWLDSNDGEGRAGAVSTLAGDAGILQVNGDTTAADTDICDIDPSHPACDLGGGDDGDDDSCPPTDLTC